MLSAQGTERFNIAFPPSSCLHCEAVRRTSKKVKRNERKSEVKLQPSPLEAAAYRGDDPYFLDCLLFLLGERKECLDVVIENILSSGQQTVSREINVNYHRSRLSE